MRSELFKSFVYNAFHKNPLRSIFVIGLTIRLLLLFLDYSFDVNNHIIWAQDLYERGYVYFYHTPSSEQYGTPYPNYPPLALFTFHLVYALQQLIFDFSWWINTHIPLFPSKLILFMESRKFVAGMMKLPAIIADLGIAYLIFKFALMLKVKSRKLQLLGVALVLFNPAFFYNSAYWGQIDAIPVLFVMMSVYTCMFSKNYLLSSALFLCALLVKPTALVFLPVYSIMFVRMYGIEKTLKALISSIMLFWICFMPFLPSYLAFFTSIDIYIYKIITTQSLPYITNAAFNFWILIAGLEGVKDSLPFIFGMSYRIWGFGIVGAIIASILYLLRKEKANGIYFQAMSLSALASFLFLTKMHERYYLLVLPFFLIYSIKNSKYLKFYYIISLLAFVNLYHSWSVPRIEPLVGILTNPLVYTSLSIVNIILFLYLSKKWIIQSFYSGNTQRLH